MNIIKLFETYKIPYDTEGKNVSPGWVQTQCPFCGDRSNHLGYHLERDYFRCWRCGGHRVIETLEKLLQVPENFVREIIREFGGTSKGYIPQQTVKIRTAKPLKYPDTTTNLTKMHKRYLKKRGYDWQEIQRLWGILGTGPIATLDERDYSYRIIIPIYWEGELVSFQARDVTGTHKLRYKACPKDREKISHQTIVYGHPDTLKTVSDILVVVEGVTDVWRLGTQAVATFGITCKRDQAYHLSKLAKELIIVFDPERHAQKEAKKLMNQILIHGGKCRIEKILGDKDPGDMGTEDAKKLMWQLTKRR